MFERSIDKFDKFEVTVPIHLIMWFDKKNLDENTERYMRQNSDAI
jgi:hypothetical protein